MSDKYLIVVLGPTASGKTAIGIEIARYYQTEIISADSRQIYKGLYIGTAQPTFTERTAIKHHLIDFVDLDRLYTVADYEMDSLNLLNLLFKNNNIVVMVGGTGLYIKSVCNGLDKIPDVPEKIRNEVELMYKEHGLNKCASELEKLDRFCYKHIDLNNKSRVLRALKVIKSTGQPIYSFFNKTSNNRDFKVIYIGLNLDKTVLLDRINKRVDKMITNGLVDEARKFIKYRNCNSLQTIGYKDVYEYLDNNTLNLENLMTNIKLRTRQYAKRQMTWFRKNKDIIWFKNHDLNNIIKTTNNLIGLK